MIRTRNWNRTRSRELIIICNIEPWIVDFPGLDNVTILSSDRSQSICFPSEIVSYRMCATSKIVFGTSYPCSRRAVAVQSSRICMHAGIRRHTPCGSGQEGRGSHILGISQISLSNGNLAQFLRYWYTFCVAGNNCLIWIFPRRDNCRKTRQTCRREAGWFRAAYG